MEDKKYVCTNPHCDSYEITVERPADSFHPVCNDCEEELEEDE